MANIRDSHKLFRSRSHLLVPKTAQGIHSITKDLTWIDMLKGIAIIGVFYENWLTYFLHHPLITVTHGPMYILLKIMDAASGPFVQLFIILSGFGLTLAYFKYCNTGWSWKQWGWRRITKIIFPYYLFVILSFLLGMIGSWLFQTMHIQFSWPSLVAYFTFTRNFYPSSWFWNPPLWYMPVIIGLYVIFPILLFILRKWGPGKLLLISLLVSYISLIIGFISGTTVSHGYDLFLFWTFQFAMGMFLAYFYINHAEKFSLLIGILPFLIGVLFIFCSWLLVTYIPYGKVFNDSITSIGVFLILLNAGWTLRNIIPSSNTFLNNMSKLSFLMYLIHYPLLEFFIGPSLKTPMHPILIIILGGVFILVVYFLCSLYAKPITKISTKLNLIFVGENR